MESVLVREVSFILRKKNTLGQGLSILGQEHNNGRTHKVMAEHTRSHRGIIMAEHTRSHGIIMAEDIARP